MEIAERAPAAEEYIALRRRVGWPSPSLEDCQRALDGSLAAVCATSDGVVVGMGRLIGDGRIYCFVVDVVVDPAFQHQGLGHTIMDALHSLATANRLGTRLDLVAAADVVAFYRDLGYSTLASELMRKTL
jgi:ribosomal protein S18 acetylase RimI-like enzyme